MKKFWNIASPVLNYVLYVILQSLAIFVHFAMHGTGVSSEKYAWRVSLVFALIQLLINGWLYYKRILITNKYAFWISVILIILLFLNFTILPELGAGYCC